VAGRRPLWVCWLASCKQFWCPGGHEHVTSPRPWLFSQLLGHLSAYVNSQWLWLSNCHYVVMTCLGLWFSLFFWCDRFRGRVYVQATERHYSTSTGAWLHAWWMAWYPHWHKTLLWSQSPGNVWCRTWSSNSGDWQPRMPAVISGASCLHDYTEIILYPLSVIDLLFTYFVYLYCQLRIMSVKLWICEQYNKKSLVVKSMAAWHYM